MDAYPKRNSPGGCSLCQKEKFSYQEVYRKTDIISQGNIRTNGVPAQTSTQLQYVPLDTYTPEKGNSTLHSRTGVKYFINIHTSLTSKMPVNDSGLPAHHPRC